MNKRQALKLEREIGREFEYTGIVRYDTGTYAVSVGELNGKRFDSLEAWQTWLDERNRNAEVFSA